MLFWILFVTLDVALCTYFLVTYNKMVKLKNSVKEAGYNLAIYRNKAETASEAEQEDAIKDAVNARKYYNAVVKEYNSCVQGFPSVLIAMMLGYKQEEYDDYKAEDKI